MISPYDRVWGRFADSENPLCGLALLGLLWFCVLMEVLLMTRRIFLGLLAALGFGATANAAQLVRLRRVDSTRRRKINGVVVDYTHREVRPC